MLLISFHSQTGPAQEPAVEANKEFPACGGQLGVPRHLEHPTFLLLLDFFSSSPRQEQENKGKMCSIFCGQVYAGPRQGEDKMMTVTANVYLPLSLGLKLCQEFYMYISLNPHSKSTKTGSIILTTSL